MRCGAVGAAWPAGAPSWGEARGKGCHPARMRGANHRATQGAVVLVTKHPDQGHSRMLRARRVAPTCSSARRPSGEASTSSSPSSGKNTSRIRKRHKVKFSYLQALWAVAHLGSLERAAALLELGEKTVSIYVHDLEKLLGVQLFSGKPQIHGRTQGTLSDAGNLLMYYTEQTLLMAYDVCQALSDLSDVHTGSLSLGVSQAAVDFLVPQLVDGFLANHADVSVDLRVADTANVCAAIALGRLDCGLVGTGIPRQFRSTLQVLPVSKVEVVLVASPDHQLLKRGAPVSPEDLYGLDFCAYTTGAGRGAAYHPALRASGLATKRLRIRSYVNNLVVLKDLVARGVGVAFVPSSAVEQEISSGKLSIVQVDGLRVSKSINLITDPRRYCSQAQRAFLQEAFDVDIVCRVGDKEERLPVYGAPFMDTDCSLQLAAEHELDLDLSELSPENSVDEMDENDQPGPSWYSEANDPLAAMRRGGVLRLMANHRATCEMALPVGEPRRQLATKLPFTLQDLQFFQVFSTKLNFKKAADEFGMTQPAMSAMVIRLEKELGVQLVESKQGLGRVELTEAGLVLQHYAEKILLLIREALKVMRDVRDVRMGNVSLGASQTTGTYLMPRLIGMFRARNPYVSVQLQVNSSRQICTAVDTGEIDVALIGSRPPESLRERLVSTAYATDELVLVVSRNHPLALEKFIEKESLYNLTFVSISEGSTVQAVQATILKQHGISWHELKVDMEFNSIEAIKSAVRFNLGVAFVSISAIDKELELGLIAKIPIRGVRLLRTLYLVSNPASYFSPAAKRFMTEVLELQPGSKETSATSAPAPSRLSHVKSRPWEDFRAARTGRLPQQPTDLGRPGALRTPTEPRE